MAAMKRRKHVILHKPIANRLKEARMTIDTARTSGVATHFMPWDSNGSMEQVMGWIRDGSIGTLREVHNWTNRPVWPQYAALPTDTPPVPEGFDWDLWLGPERERPYHPNYTHMVFRGWYDFGGGSMADMGHYSLWTVFRALELSGPTSDRADAKSRLRADRRCLGHRAQRFLLPLGERGALQVSGDGTASGDRSDLVRRRTAAADAGGTG